MNRRDVVVVTGATAGVGRATVEAFARRGAHIGLLARGQNRLEQTLQRVEALGGKALILPTDVADADQVEAAAQRVEETFGPIDIWINNAMTAVFSEFQNVTPEEYRRVTDVVYHGQVYGTMAALKRMLPRDQGSIVLVGSALSYRGIPLQSAYCGAKHGIEGMFDSIRSELLHRKSNVRISMVHLPGMNTPQFSWVRNKLGKKTQPVPPIYQPEVAAEAILWAAYHEEREVLVGRPTVTTIIGNKIAPGFADRVLASQGYSGQMRDEPEDPNRPDNLFEPHPGDFGAHGEFDARATYSGWTPQMWTHKNRPWIALAGIGVAGLVTTLLLRK